MIPILLKFLMFFLSVTLILVILIPNHIRKMEAEEINISRANMTSIYEGIRYAQKKTGHIYKNSNELLIYVQNDSGLIQNKTIIQSTKQLIRLFDNFISIPQVRSFVSIRRHLHNIISELKSNKANFNSNEIIRNEAEELGIIFSDYMKSEAHPEFSQVLFYIDTLLQLRNEITSHTLPVAASLAAEFIGRINSVIGKIQTGDLQESWSPIKKQIEKFTAKVKQTKISELMNAGDRLDYFSQEVDSDFDLLIEINNPVNLEMMDQVFKDITILQTTFSSDKFLKTKYALQHMSAPDSMMLQLSENAFRNPINHEAYKIIIDAASHEVKIESPVLLEDLIYQCEGIVHDLKRIGSLTEFNKYTISKNELIALLEKLEVSSIHDKSVIALLKTISQHDELEEAAGWVQLYHACWEVQRISRKSESFSDIRLRLEDCLNSIYTIEQNTLEINLRQMKKNHLEFIGSIDFLNSELKQYRAEKSGLKNIEVTVTNLDEQVNKFLFSASHETVENFDEIANKLNRAFRFCNEGKSISRYIFFKKHIRNEGYIFRDIKSWESDRITSKLAPKN